MRFHGKQIPSRYGRDVEAGGDALMENLLGTDAKGNPAVSVKVGDLIGDEVQPFGVALPKDEVGDEDPLASMHDAVGMDL